MLYKIIILWFVLITIAQSTELNIKINSKSDTTSYRYVLIKLSIGGGVQLTTKVSNSSNFTMSIDDSLELEFPVAVNLQVNSLDSMSSSKAHLFELVSEVTEISLDSNYRQFSVSDDGFQTEYSKFIKEISKLEKEKKLQQVCSELISFTRQYPEHPINFLFFSKIINVATYSQLREIEQLIKNSNSKNKQLVSLKELANEALKKRLKYSEGEALTILDSLQNLDGKDIKLDLSKGKKFIYIWATTCGPCIKKLKHYKDIAPKSKVPELIIISTDNNFEKWKKFQEVNKLHYESYISKGKAITNIFQIEMLPFSIYLENGIVKKINPELSDYFEK